MKKHYVSAALAALSFASSAFACDGSGNEYIGSVCLTAATFCPANVTVEANGQLLSVQNNPALFSLYGFTYGGNGSTTFGVPDLRGRTPVGYGQGPGLTTVQFARPRGQESVTLTAANLPAHTHPFAPTTGDQNVTIPASTGANMTLSGTIGVVNAKANTASGMTPTGGTTYQMAGTGTVGPYSTAALPATPALVSGVSVNASGMTPNIPAKTVTVQTVTGGAVGANPTANYPIATIPPQVGLRYCIVTLGTYPTQP